MKYDLIAAVCFFKKCVYNCSTSIYSMLVIDANIIAAGDDDGRISVRICYWIKQYHSAYLALLRPTWMF